MTIYHKIETMELLQKFKNQFNPLRASTIITILQSLN